MAKRRQRGKAGDKTICPEQSQAQRRGSRTVWLVDETYIRIDGRWCYLYRGIDRDGNLVDVRLSKTQDIEGTKAFFAQALELHEVSPEKAATDVSLLSLCH